MNTCVHKQTQTHAVGVQYVTYFATDASRRYCWNKQINKEIKMIKIREE